MKKEKQTVMAGQTVRRNEQLVRVFTLIHLLEAHSRGLTVNQALSLLKEKGFQVEKRTVYRDFEGIRALGFSLTEEKEPGGDAGATVFSMDRTRRFSEHLAVEQRELIALYLARQTLQPLRGTPFYRDLESLFSKLDAKIGKSGREFLEELGREIHFSPGPIWGLGVSAETIDSVHWAISEGHQIACMYNSANQGARSRRVLGPHVLYFATGALYLLAEDMNSGRVKVFSLSRMTEVERLDEEYAGKRTDPEEFFAHSIGVFRGEGKPEPVRILLSGPESAWVKDRSWHHSQRVVNRSGGAFELHLEVMVTPELVNMVLGFGPGAEVLEPAVLRERVGEAATSILKRTENNSRKAAS